MPIPPWPISLRTSKLPNFFGRGLDATVITMNVDAWNKLSGKAKSLINKVALEYEKTSVTFMERERAAEEKVLHAAGVKDIELKGAAAKKYLSIAHSEIWKQLKQRSEYSDRLRAKLYIP